MAKINHYITMLLFTVMFLVGLQVPAFMDQYTKRVDAQVIEVARLLRQYQQIADKYHNGSMSELIALHEKSQNQTFNDESVVITQHVEREQYLSSHLEHLNHNVFRGASTILFQVDEDIYTRTIEQYTMSIQFTKLSLIFAAFMAVFSCALYELILFIMKKMGVKALSIRHKYS